MSDTGATATKILQAIEGAVAGDSPVLAAGLSRKPAAATAPGFSDLFTSAAGLEEGAAADYCFALEYIYEGYLLHYGNSRIFADAQQSLALLAGDYMYARGLNLVTARGDLASIRLLSELIDYCALVHCEGLDAGLAADAWAVTTLRVAAAAAGDAGDGAWDTLPRQAGDAAGHKNELTAQLDRLLECHAESQAAGLRDELCNIYSSFHQQRRQDGTG